MNDEVPTVPGQGADQGGDDGSPVHDHREDRVQGHVDGLEEVRDQLEGVTELPIEERAAVLAAVNEAIVAELNAMEEV